MKKIGSLLNILLHSYSSHQHKSYDKGQSITAIVAQQINGEASIPASNPPGILFETNAAYGSNGDCFSIYQIKKNDST